MDPGIEVMIFVANWPIPCSWMSIRSVVEVTVAMGLSLVIRLGSIPKSPIDVFAFRNY